MRLFLLVLMLVTCSIASSQSVMKDSISNALSNIQLRQTNFNKMAMWSLNSWAVGNITYGTIANFQTTGEAKYFHQMNAIWNTVNLGIGIPGMIGAYKKQEALSFEELYKNQRRYETIYLFNAGLDLAYVSGGVALREYGKRLTDENGARFRGYGSSLIFQGAYLFAHDLAVYILLKTNTRLFDKQWQHVKLSYGGVNLLLEFH